MTQIAGMQVRMKKLSNIITQRVLWETFLWILEMMASIYGACHMGLNWSVGVACGMLCWPTPTLLSGKRIIAARAFLESNLNRVQGQKHPALSPSLPTFSCHIRSALASVFLYVVLVWLHLWPIGYAIMISLLFLGAAATIVPIWTVNPTLRRTAMLVIADKQWPPAPNKLILIQQNEDIASTSPAVGSAAYYNRLTLAIVVDFAFHVALAAQTLIQLHRQMPNATLNIIVKSHLLGFEILIGSLITSIFMLALWYILSTSHFQAKHHDTNRERP